MRFFPQLETLTVGQFPLRRERHERVVRHESLDGRVRAYYDANGSRLAWTLQYQGLTDGERGAINSLFDECEGRLQDFVFLDPASNLLRWSEDYGQGVWVKDPMLGFEPGQPDRLNTFRATKIENSAGIVQGISQTITAPGSLQYCFSGWIQGADQPFKMRLASGGVVVEREFVAQLNWKRFFVAGRPATNAEGVSFRIELGAGSTLNVAGLQAEAQPAPGDYRQTKSRSGVFLKARFAEDELAWTQQAPNNNAATIRIVSR